ncbi:MAG: phenylacetyl CoA, partial [Burkholderiales bacterium]|nr:phenylacetyl CoA [Burkholderiales bacterium]
MSGFGPKPWVQQHWDWRAATNFMLGGAGAGLIFAAGLILDEIQAPFAIGLA